MLGTLWLPFAVALGGCGSTPQPPNTPSFAGGEPVNHSLQTDYAAPLQGHILWFTPFAGPALSSPAVYDGLVYAGGTDGFLRALDARRGALRRRAGLSGSLSDQSR